MTDPGRIVEALGGAKALHASVRTVNDLRASVQRGLPYGTLDAVSTNYGLPRPLVVRALQVPERTLMRRKQAARFHADESDRLVRLARLAAIAEDVLGTREKAGRWLQKPNRALGGTVPLEQLDTELGARQVEELLGRIAHGIVS